MRLLFRKKTSQRGWTIIELMMVVGMIGLIVPALTSLFIYCYQGLAAAEMHLSLKALNEQIMLHLHERINSSKHMFQNDSNSGGLSFISKIAMGSAPTSVSFSKLPSGQTGTTITFSPAAGAVSNEFGDCLFYADYDSPQTINGIKYTAPLTVGGPITLSSAPAPVSVTGTVTNGAGNSVTVNLDVYRFYYDYLSTAGDMTPIASLTSYWLIEWQSVQFVDAFELIDIQSSDSTLYAHVINWLTTAGNFPSGQPITLAWDPSQIQMTSGSNFAFYQLSGSTMTGASNQSISIQNWTPLSRTSSGLVSRFNYGISGNYNNIYGDPPPPIVPMFNPYTNTANAFPGGFEVGIQGSNAGMQVLVRSLLIAKGNYKTLMWDNETSISNARDVW